MRTTLVTLTRGDAHDWFATMLDSVPANVVHEIITVPPNATHEQWAEARVRALREARTPFVGFLDDDDVVHSQAVEWCERALDATGAGVAFTQEARIDAFDNVIEEPVERQRFYFEVRLMPRIIHHLALMRRELIPDDALDVERELGFGFEWWIKARCAFAAGAVQVPRVGYFWRQRSGQMSESHDWRIRYAAGQRLVGDRLQPFVGSRSIEPIPKFTP
jgi:glycosyltransferase involved in cell wall biosynthesis